jgi:hypothetical protein
MWVGSDSQAKLAAALFIQVKAGIQTAQLEYVIAQMLISVTAIDC